MAINHQLVPSNGWQFYEEKTNTRLIATDRASLARHVRDHRASNGLPSGDIDADIDSQIEKEHPELSI